MTHHTHYTLDGPGIFNLDLILSLAIGPKMSVPDKRSRILEVVIVRHLLTWVLGIWSGEGMGRVEEGEVSLRVTRDRGGRILSQKGGFPSK